ncbi:MAG: VOC family protein [Xenococcaceae cyanobacterium MO_188.B32]|nr:VOC family protein [Xenococcaceae cyanobacterium MO_188.B32]
MQIDHVHFYTRDAVQTSNWLSRNIGFQAIAKNINSHTYSQVVANNSVFLLISSALKPFSPVSRYLNFHPSGVADIAFRVPNIESILAKADYLKVNINEPTSPNSQIQEFLDINHGSGIQHIALRSTNILQTVAKMRSRGTAFLSVPTSYYRQLQKIYSNRSIPSLADWEWQAIESQQVLVDWHQEKPESLLMQIFTQPIFDRPTFFWELIERRKQAQGFGEANFQALFEAVEREQVKRK